jgi:hypothetical protein
MLSIHLELTKLGSVKLVGSKIGDIRTVRHYYRFQKSKKKHKKYSSHQIDYYYFI